MKKFEIINDKWIRTEDSIGHRALKISAITSIYNWKGKEVSIISLSINGHNRINISYKISDISEHEQYEKDLTFFENLLFKIG